MPSASPLWRRTVSSTLRHPSCSLPRHRTMACGIRCFQTPILLLLLAQVITLAPTAKYFFHKGRMARRLAPVPSGRQQGNKPSPLWFEFLGGCVLLLASVALLRFAAFSGMKRSYLFHIERSPKHRWTLWTVNTANRQEKD